MEYCKCCKSYSRLIKVRLTLVSSWAGCSSGVPLNQNTSNIHFKMYSCKLKLVIHVQNIVKIHIISSQMEYCKYCKIYSPLIEARLILVSDWFLYNWSYATTIGEFLRCSSKSKRFENSHQSVLVGIKTCRTRPELCQHSYYANQNGICLAYLKLWSINQNKVSSLNQRTSSF